MLNIFELFFYYKIWNKVFKKKIMKRIRIYETEMNRIQAVPDPKHWLYIYDIL